MQTQNLNSSTDRAADDNHSARTVLYATTGAGLALFIALCACLVVLV